MGEVGPRDDRISPRVIFQDSKKRKPASSEPDEADYEPFAGFDTGEPSLGWTLQPPPAVTARFRGEC